MCYEDVSLMCFKTHARQCFKWSCFKMAGVRDGQPRHLLHQALRLQILFFCFSPTAASLSLHVQNDTQRFVFYQDKLSEISFFLTGAVEQAISIIVRHTAEGETNYTNLCMLQQKKDECSSNVPEVCVCEAQKFRYRLRKRFQLKDTGTVVFVIWEQSRGEKTVEIVIIRTTSSQHERWTTIQAIDNSTVLWGLTPSTANHSNSLNLNIVVVLTCVAIVVCALIVFIVAAKCLFRKYSMGGRLQQELFVLSGNSASARTGDTGLLSTSFPSDRNLAPEHYDHTFQATKIEDENAYSEINSYDHGTYLSAVERNLPEYVNTAPLHPVT